MKAVKQFLSYLLPFKQMVFLVVLANGLAALLEIVSLASIIPFLELLFKNEPPIPAEGTPFNWVFWPLNEAGKVLKANATYHFALLFEKYGSTRLLLWICLAIPVIFLLKNLMVYIGKLIIERLSFSVGRQKRQQMYEKILTMPARFFTDRNKGDLLTRFTSDIQETESGILNVLHLLIKQPFLIVFFLIAMFLISVNLSLFVLILIPVLGTIISKISQSLKRHSIKGQVQLGKLVERLEETLFGHKIVKAFTAEKYLSKRFSGENLHHFNIMNRIVRRRLSASPVSELMGIIIVAIVLWYGGRLVLQGNGDLTPTLFIAFLIFFARLNQPVKGISDNYARVQKAMASAQRVEQILVTENTITNVPDAVSLSTFEKEIVFDNVSFSYEKNQRVLHEINLRIKKGETVALVGQSGGGKSTIADLIPRFYDIEKGEILIDNHNIKQLKLSDLRHLIGVVTQDPILFNDTVLNNIAFGIANVNESAVKKAAEIAHAHHFIEKLKNGYHTIIGERGVKLSGGQRQRLTIARAILKNPPILILDEATSSLDTESEKWVHEALNNVMKDRTSLVIAHRLSTIQNADNIYVLQDGRVVEQGNHAELIKKSGSYKSLVELQKL